MKQQKITLPLQLAGGKMIFTNLPPNYFKPAIRQKITFTGIITENLKKVN